MKKATVRLVQRAGVAHTPHASAHGARRTKKAAAIPTPTPNFGVPQQGEETTSAGPCPIPYVPSLADVLSQLREYHRQRQDYHQTEKSLTLRIKSIQRRRHASVCPNPPSGNARKCKCDEAVIYPEIQKDDAHLYPIEASRLLFEQLRGARATPQATGRARKQGPEVEMTRLAMLLPVWPWAKAIAGFGALGLAQIIAECGDLSKYSDPAKVWARMGLGRYRREDGEWERQQKAAGQNGVLAQYNPRRRSLMYCIGECIVKQGDVYRALYLERKTYEATKPACGTYKCKGDHCTPGHAHNRAKRYMEKRLLRDLWREWKKAKGQTLPSDFPSATPAKSSTSGKAGR